MATRAEQSSIDLDGEQLGGADDEEGLLERVAATLGSTLDLKTVLRRLAEIGLEASSALRCSIVLLSERGLEPAVAISVRSDEDLWDAYRAMPPIQLEARHWDLVLDHQVAVIEDARESDLVPDTWVERFSLRAIAVVPLRAHRELCGVMAVDWPVPGPPAARELGLLRTIGTYAGLAISHARLHESTVRRSKALEHLVEVATSVNSSSSLAPVLDRVCAGFEDILGTTHCSVNLIDPEHPLQVKTLATRGAPWFSPRSGRAGAVPPEELTGVDRLWAASGGPIVYPVLDASGAGRPLVVPPRVRSAVLFPIFVPDGLIGSVMAGFPRRGRPAPEVLETGQTLAELAAAAIERARLHEQLGRRLRQVETLYRLSGVVSGVSDLPTALRELNDGMGSELGVHLESVVLSSPEVRLALGADAPSGDEAVVLDAWQRVLEAGGVLRLDRVGTVILAPVAHGGRVLGTVRVTAGDGPPVDLHDDDFLLTIGRACGEAVHRATLARELPA